MCLNETVDNIWIPVNEKLPEENKGVIVTIREEDGRGGYEYFVSTSWVQDGGIWCIRKNHYNPTVIAWRYFPQPYME